MRLQGKTYINEIQRQEGWQERISGNKVEIAGNEGRIKIEVTKDNLRIESEGEVEANLIREGRRARLPANCEGKIQNGDEILMGKKEAIEEYVGGRREDFEGVLVKARVEEEEKFEKQDIFVQERREGLEKKNPKFNLILGGVVLCLLIAGTILGYQKRSAAEESKKFEEIKSAYANKKKEIESVRSMNIDTALELAKNAEDILNNSGVAEKKYSQQLGEMRQEVQNIKSELGAVGTSYEVAYDANLISGKLGFEKMAIKGEQVYLWSPEGGRVEEVNINLKSTDHILTDEKAKNWKGIFNSGEKWYGYDQNKIYEIKRESLVETEISQVGAMAEMKGWNGLIYLIDNNDKSIKKIVNGNGQNWLKDGDILPEDGSSLGIDGSIWVLGKSGKIYHYNRGVKESFKMSFEASDSSVGSLATSEEVNFLAYVANENSVMIYGKDGKIWARYNFDNLKIKDLAIEDQEKAVLVLADNDIIYRIKINEVL